MRNKLLIGLSGKSESGKTTAVEYIQQLIRYENQHTLQVFAFADALKRMADALIFPQVINWNDEKSKNEEIHTVKASDLNRVLTGRELLTRLADATKSVTNDRIFVEQTMFRAESTLMMVPHEPTIVIISDVRYPHEAAAITRQGGFVIRIERSNLDFTKSKYFHSSETALDNAHPATFFSKIYNNGEIEDFKTMIGLTLNQIITFTGKDLMPYLHAMLNENTPNNIILKQIDTAFDSGNLACYEWSPVSLKP
jgi:hypothetical protein